MSRTCKPVRSFAAVNEKTCDNEPARRATSSNSFIFSPPSAQLALQSSRSQVQGNSAIAQEKQFTPDSANTSSSSNLTPFHAARAIKDVNHNWHSQTKHYKPQNRLGIQLSGRVHSKSHQALGWVPRTNTNKCLTTQTNSQKWPRISSQRDIKWLQDRKWPESEILGSGGIVAQAWNSSTQKRLRQEVC